MIEGLGNITLNQFDICHINISTDFTYVCIFTSDEQMKLCN